MDKIVSIKDVEDVLTSYALKVSKYSGDGKSLERMQPLLEVAGNPHRKLKVIHIAGTSGKTSTAYYISALLSSENIKVGMTISPHIDSITERVQINGEPLGREEFCSEFGIFMDLIKDIAPVPSYFELLIAFVLWEFVRQEVDYAVLETGLGGLLDATNIVTSADKICVITDIGLDHISVLGNTVSDIAVQKAGIIQSNNQVFMYKQGDDIMSSIQERVDQKQATLNLLSSKIVGRKDLNVTKLPLFQQRNWGIAYAVINYVNPRDNLKKRPTLNPLTVTIPGRMEIIKLQNGLEIIMDGSHNQQKARAFVKSYQWAYPNTKVPILLAIKKGKSYQTVIDELQPIATVFILTSLNTAQDSFLNFVDPAEIHQYCQKKGIPSEVYTDLNVALKKLIEQELSLSIITGSIYLLGLLRKSNLFEF